MVLQAEPMPLRRPDVPEGLARVIRRALEKDPNRRFADVPTFREALKPFAA